MIEYLSFMEYLETRKKRVEENTSRKNIINKIKELPEDKLIEIEKFLNSKG